MMFVTTAHAQSFNTISNSKPHYRIAQVVQKRQEAPSADSTSIYKQKEPTAAAVDSHSPLSIVHSPLASPLHITSPYGMRRHPVTGKMRLHAGVDLRANFEPVYAMLPGEVLNVGYEPKGGNFISLKHGNIKVTYCHLSHIGIAKGSTVYAGQPIGISGNSGQYTTGPHLHLGIKDLQSGQPISASKLLAIIKDNS